jgi:hypothetical protein
MDSNTERLKKLLLDDYSKKVILDEFLEKLKKIKGLEANTNFTIKNSFIEDAFGHSRHAVILAFKPGEKIKKASGFLGKVKGAFPESKYDKETIQPGDRQGSIRIEMPMPKNLKEKANELKEVDLKQKKQASVIHLIDFFKKIKLYAYPEIIHDEILIECVDLIEGRRVADVFGKIGVKVIENENSIIQITTPEIPLKEPLERTRKIQNIQELIRFALWLLDKHFKLEPLRKQEIKDSNKVDQTTPLNFKSTSDMSNAKKILRLYGFKFMDEEKLSIDNGFRLQFEPIISGHTNGETIIKMPTKSPSEVAKSHGFKTNGMRLKPDVKNYTHTRATLLKKARMAAGQKINNNDLRTEWLKELKNAMKAEGYIVLESKKNADYSFEFERPKPAGHVEEPIIVSKKPVDILKKNGFKRRNAATPKDVKTAKYNPDTKRVSIDSPSSFFTDEQIKEQVEFLKKVFLNLGFTIPEIQRDMWKSFVIEAPVENEESVIEIPTNETTDTENTDVSLNQEVDSSTKEPIIQPVFLSTENAVALLKDLPVNEMIPKLMDLLPLELRSNLKLLEMFFASKFVERITAEGIIILRDSEMFNFINPEKFAATQKEVIMKLIS